jgi:hypothetical protein
MTEKYDVTFTMIQKVEPMDALFARVKNSFAYTYANLNFHHD